MRHSRPGGPRLRDEQSSQPETARSRGGAVSQVGYVAAAWGVTLVAVGLYAAGLRTRGHRLMRRVRSANDNSGE